MVKNLITGGGGFVASHLAELLLSKGEEVFVTTRWNEDLSRIKHIKDKLTIIPMDLNDFPSCLKCIEDTKPDYIFHLAAESYVSDSYIRGQVTLQTNIIGTYNLLESVRIVRDRNGYLFPPEKKKEYFYDPIVHVCSSSEVYGLVDESLIPIKEDCRFNPSNPYAVSKVGEDMVALLYWTNYGIKTIRTRMFTHSGYSRTMLSAECNFAKQIAEMEKKGPTYNKKEGGFDFVIKHGNLESIRTFADVRDAVKAYYLLVRKGKPGEAYNIGGLTKHTIAELLDYLISLSSIKDKIQKEQDPKLMRPYDVTLQIPDCSKFIKETNWKPEHTFEETMSEVLRYWRENV